MRPFRAIPLALLLSATSMAQTLDLGSMGGPDLGDRSVFAVRASDLSREAEALYAQTDGWDDLSVATRASDAALAFRAGATMRFLASRLLEGENARQGAADRRMVTGLLIVKAIPSFDARVQRWIDDAAAVHDGSADVEAYARYAHTRAVLVRFVRTHDARFGTPGRTEPLGFTVRSEELALRPTLSTLLGMLDDGETALVARAWHSRGSDTGVREQRDVSERSASTDGFWHALERAETSPAYRTEARRLAMLAREAQEGVASFALVDPEVAALGEEALGAAIGGALGASGGSESRAALRRLAGAGRVLRAIAPLRADADRDLLGALDALAEDCARFALASPQGAPSQADGLLDAFDGCVRTLALFADRRALDEPVRMTGHMRRAWMLMHTEQADRELSMIAELRRVVASPRLLTSPAYVSSLSRTRRGFERLQGLQRSDAWLDELRQDGRLAALLGPTVSQRSRDLLIFTLRDRIRDAADKDVRERALDDLNALRERAEAYGLDAAEEALARDAISWLGDELGPELARALASARTNWVQAWVDDDTPSREHWSSRLGILTRARDMVALAITLEDPSLLEKTSAWPGVLWPEGAGRPLRDRVRGLARGAVRSALRDDPSTTDDDEDHRARLTVFEDESAGAAALVDLAALIPDDARTIEEPFVRLMAARAVMLPRDHPAYTERDDLGSYVRWVHELLGSERRDREAILLHLDEVGADLRSRLRRD